MRSSQQLINVQTSISCYWN